VEKEKKCKKKKGTDKKQERDVPRAENINGCIGRSRRRRKKRKAPRGKQIGGGDH